MVETVRACIVLLLAMTVLVGGIYPFMVTGLAQVAFPENANGSLIQRDGKVIGSKLLGQQFENPKYFWGRLSATTPAYNAAASGGSNFSPSNPKLHGAAHARVAALQKADPKNTNPIPVDLVTASGSGLDPHISIAAAEHQVPRVAKARKVSEAEIAEVLKEFRRDSVFGVVGEPRVNVLRLNIALDERFKTEKKEKR